MANSFTADFPEIWAREQQIVFHKTNIAQMITDMTPKAQLSRGDTFNKPYRSAINVQSYTRWTSITIDDLTDTQEQLSINSEFATGFYIDDFDKVQSNYNLAANYGRDAWIKLANQVDTDVLWQYANSTSSVDDGEIGGTSGNWISLTTSNVLEVVAAAKRKIAKQNVPLNNLFGAVSPEFEEILVQYGAGRDTQMGDVANANWFIGSFYGFKLFSSNQLSGSATLAMATQPTDGDTVVIDGITFTFKTTIGSTAGNVLIGWSADVARANLTSAINDPSTTDANQVAVSTANQRVLDSNYTATNDNSADTMTLVAKWTWVLVLSETFTDGTDTWTATLEKQHCLFGSKWGTTLVMQSEPSLRIREVETKLWVNILNWVLYWVKTFTDWANQLVDVQLRSDTYS